MAHGLHGATIEQITEAAQFTRGAFYSNFASKEELFLAVIEQRREALMARLSSEIDAVDVGAGETLTPATLGLLLLRALNKGAEDRRWIVAQMETLQAALRDRALAERQLEIRRRDVAEFSQLVVHGLDRLGRRLSVDPEVAVQIVLGVADRYLTDILLEDAELDQMSLRAAEPLSAVILGLSRPKSNLAPPS